MGRAATVRDVASTAARPARESLAEIGFMFSLTFVIGLGVMWSAAGGDITKLWEASVLAGASVLNELSWVFGLYVPTLLGFYVLVTGEQLGQVTNAGRLRRILGVVAEFSFAALLPGVLLVAIYCVSSPATIGALFAVVPATFVLAFLTVQLGGFVVFELAVQLADAEQLRDQSQSRLAILKSRSRRPLWSVLAFTVVVLSVLGLVVFGFAGEWGWLLQWPTYVFAIGGAAVATAVGSLVAGMLAIRSLWGRIGALSTVLLVSVFLVSAVWTQSVLQIWPVVAVIVAQAAVATLSAVGPPSGAWGWAVDWSLAGAADRVAARSAVSAYVRSSRRIVELQRMIASNGRPTWSQRFASLRARISAQTSA